PEAFAPGAFPIFAEKGYGSHLFDVDGQEYIDYLMALGPITLGYCYPSVDRAVVEQLQKGMILSLPHALEVEAARLLQRLIPCAEMVRFFKTGAEATAAAVRVARAFTGREKILSCGYHGWHDIWSAELPTPGSNGIPESQRGGVITFAYNDFFSPSSLENVLKRHAGETAAIIMTANDYWETETDGYLEWVRRMADDYGVLLVFDEIVTGFRMAAGGAQDYFKVIPDMACFAKGMANGMPISALVGKRNVLSGMKDLLISTTYGGEILSLAALTATCREYQEKPVIEHLWQYGTRLMLQLNNLAEENGIKCKFLGYSPMTGFKFFYEDERLNIDLMTFFLQENARRGVLIRRGGPIYISYSHSEEDLAKTLAVNAEVFSELAQVLKEGNLSERLIIRDCILNSGPAGIKR
ncbi:MAG: aminotransferase class III-fold pyridoxal phosphate-dependent enzyme, partial [bacterium]|nr:aminotransferase class III-fold pyridoxal phosphate-dependent enzyme [bacterium]